MGQARANTEFNGLTVVTFGINSIVNLNALHAGDLSGLEVSGSFQNLTDAGSSYLYTSGDGNVTADNPDVPSFSVGSSFSHSFSVGGSALDGSVDSLNTGVFNLDFNASGDDDYEVNLTLTQDISVSASGLFANMTNTLDFGSLDGELQGSDFIAAATFEGVNSDVQSSHTVQNWVFTMPAGGQRQLFAQSIIAGNISTVPIPGALWLFGSALVWLGAFRARRFT